MPLPPRRKLPPPLESQEQVTFLNWFQWQHPHVLIFSIPNGGHLAGGIAQRAAQVARLKAEGMRPGVPDLYIPAWNLFIEMKRQSGGRLSEEQKTIHSQLRGVGKTVIVAKGWEDARDQVMAFLGARRAAE